MRTVTKAMTLLVTGTLLMGCSGGPGSGSATTSPRGQLASGRSTAPAARIPDGTWTREVTTAEIARRGLHIAPEVITSNYLDDGSVRLVLKTQGSRWSILVEDDAGAFEVGDQGDTSYDEQGRWVQASDSTGGSGTLAWKVAADMLTTSIPVSTSERQASDDERLFIEGAWRRQG